MRAAARRWRWSPRARARDTRLRGIADRRYEAAIADAAAAQAEDELHHYSQRVDALANRAPRRAGWAALIGKGMAEAAEHERHRAQQLRQGDGNV